MANRKVLLMSHCVPPIVRGPSVVLNRLFKMFNIAEYCILTSDFSKKQLETDSNLKLPCVYYYIDIEPVVGGSLKGRRNIIRRWLETANIVFEGRRIIKKQKIDALLVYPTHGNFLLAAFFLRLLTDVKLYIYFFDLFAVNFSGSRFDMIMKRVSQWAALKAADGIMVMSEPLKEYYQNIRSKLSVSIIRHPVDSAKYAHKGANRVFEGGSQNIVFTGMIYEYQADSIKDVADAVKELEGVELHIYSPRDKAYLLNAGIINDRVVYHGYVPEKDVSLIQSAASILLLPMTFAKDGIDADVVKTASPSKIGEYLASGRPILVHAPRESYIAWYAQNYGWGEVSTSRDKNALKKSILRILNDKELSRKLVKNSAKTLLLHEAGAVGKIFKNALNISG